MTERDYKLQYQTLLDPTCAKWDFPKSWSHLLEEGRNVRGMTGKNVMFRIDNLS